MKEPQKHVNPALSDQVRVWVCGELEQVAAKVDLDLAHLNWDVSWHALPSGTVANQWMPQMLIFLSIPVDPEDREKGFVSGVPVLPFESLTKEFVTSLVRDGVRSLLKTREEHLAAAE